MNTIGTKLTLTIFGSSHGEYAGCILKGLPKNYQINFEKIKSDLFLRKPSSEIGTARVERDYPEIQVTDEGIMIRFNNENTNSSEYELFKTFPRPGHADYPALIKYGEGCDASGGGIFSGRMTAPLVAAGALLRDFLGDAGISVCSYTTRVGNVSDEGVHDPEFVMTQSRTNPLRAMNKNLEEKMRAEILAAKNAGDSVGGIIRCIVMGVPPGVGEPFFDTLDGEIAKAVFAIPGVKGISFGEGFNAAKLLGSVNNDAYEIKNGAIATKTNHAGGVLGGISNGATIDFSVAFKPTPSIAKKQQTVNLETFTNSELEIKGRHDPCIVPRAAIAVEAMTIFTLADLLLRGGFL